MISPPPSTPDVVVKEKLENECADLVHFSTLKME
jgi:hypothetical protein